MQSTCAWILLNFLIYTAASLENEQKLRKTKAFIELTELGYEDACYNTAEAEWSFINSPTNETLVKWEENLLSYANFKKVQKYEVANMSDTVNNRILKYKYNVIQKAGDALMTDEHFQTLVHFVGVTDSLKASTLNIGKLQNYTRTDIEHTLSRNNNIEEKRNIWTTWHNRLAPLVANFSSNLPLIQEAAKENGATDITEYWELLSGYTNGYEEIKNEWDTITYLHKKILNFVMTNLSHKYGITVNETIPAYLLGSLEGNDWTTISMEVSPYPNLMYNIRKQLWKRKLIGKSLYKSASAMGTKILNHVPEANFWDNSQFNQQCPSKLINLCKNGNMRISTCFEPSISNFLAAHKNVGKILFNQMSVEATPVLNTANRYSGIETGISELFGILAASPAWLNYTKLMDNSSDAEEHLIMSLMITALNILPRLAYYISTDLWRLNAIENRITEPDELIASWWKYRQEYEGISFNGSNIATFLNDDYIIKNKPYLPEFAGTLLAFHFYQYVMDSTEVRYEQLTSQQISANFIKMIQLGSADDWMKVVDKYLDINAISAISLTSFFAPLEEFLDDIDETYEYKSIASMETEIEELEKKVIAEINAPTTTTTTAAPIEKTETTKPVPITKLDREKSDINVISNFNKNVESKSSIHEQTKESGSHHASKTEASTNDSLDESLINIANDEEDTKPKINTSKAVWAVGSVLLATIIICIIAIFGRQRCRKTPKNRRYV